MEEVKKFYLRLLLPDNRNLFVCFSMLFTDPFPVMFIAGRC